VIERHAQRLRGRARLVTIDLDPTDDPTHGAQQLSFFNGHYDSWCYLPVMGFVSFNERSRTVSVCGCVASRQRDRCGRSAGILRRLITMISYRFPVRVSGCASTAALRIPICSTFWRTIPTSSTSLRWPKRGLKRKAQTSHEASPQAVATERKTEHVYGEANYAARTWPQQRRHHP